MSFIVKYLILARGVLPAFREVMFLGVELRACGRPGEPPLLHARGTTRGPEKRGLPLPGTSGGSQLLETLQVSSFSDHEPLLGCETQLFALFVDGGLDFVIFCEFLVKVLQILESTGGRQPLVPLNLCDHPQLVLPECRESGGVCDRVHPSPRGQAERHRRWKRRATASAGALGLFLRQGCARGPVPWIIDGGVTVG